MTFGLAEAGALARICYYAGELSLLAAQPGGTKEMNEVKTALDEAWRDFNTTKEIHARSN